MQDVVAVAAPDPGHGALVTQDRVDPPPILALEHERLELR
jgi:hypothetical protein